MPPEGWVPQGDGVFRGGGVKGLGLAGALLGFSENKDFPITEWVNVGGASAGAIIASYLAVEPEAVHRLEGLLKSAPFDTFEDYPGGNLVGGGLNLLEHHGLARGVKFEEWFGKVLDHKTFSEVRNADDTGWRLKLVAVDVTTHSLVLLPDDLNRYRETPDGPVLVPGEFPIARAARMSMSIPYLFEPVVLYRDRVRCTDPGGTVYPEGLVIDRVDAEVADAAASEAGRAPASWADVEVQPSYIIDGGTLSNFPVWMFDREPEDGRPRRMTFGFTLTGGRGLLPGGGLMTRLIPWPVKFGMEIFHTASSAWDDRFASHSTTLRTVTVDAGDVGTAEFDLSDERKDALIASGRRAAAAYLKEFDPTRYVNTYGQHLADTT